MNDIAPVSSGNGQPGSQAQRRVRHGLIEDWRDAVGILFLLLVAAFFGALIARFWPDTDEPTGQMSADLTARFGAIEARLAEVKSSDLKDRVAKLEKRVATAEAILTAGSVGGTLAATALNAIPGAGVGPTLALTPTPTDATRKLVDDIGARLAALETKTGTAPDDIKAAKDSIGSLSAKLEDFSQRLGKLESSDLLEMARRASLATAIANLTRAAQGSSPFKREYDVVAAMLPNEPRLAALAPIAVKGMPTASTLMTNFGNLADQALDAERVAKSQDWGAKLWANFASLVSARTVGETGDNTTEGRLARAEIRLKSGDLPAAVKEIGAINGEARAPLRPWLLQAAGRIKLETTLADLNTQAIEALSGPPASNEPVPQLPAP